MILHLSCNSNCCAVLLINQHEPPMVPQFIVRSPISAEALEGSGVVLVPRRV